MQVRILITFVVAFMILTFGIAMANFERPSMPYKAYYNNLTEDTKKEIECLAENIYFEAGHEPDVGKVAVAFVTGSDVLSVISARIKAFMAVGASTPKLCKCEVFKAFPPPKFLWLG